MKKWFENAKFTPPWAVAALAFGLGAVSSGLSVWTGARDLLFGEPYDPPDIVTSFIAIPENTFFDQSVRALTGGAMITNMVTTEPNLSDAETESFLAEANKLALYGQDCESNQIECPPFSHIRSYLVGMIIKNAGGSAVQSGTADFLHFDLDRSPRPISFFSINHTRIVDGCLFHFEERPCTLHIGTVVPKSFSVSLPDISPGQQVFIPIFRALQPSGSYGVDPWIQLQWGDYLDPSSVTVQYGNGQKLEIEPREMLENVIQLSVDAFGLG